MAVQDSVWVTALVLAYLRTALSSQQAEWVLLERKALRWLSRSVSVSSSSEADAAVEAVIAAAAAVLG